MLLITELGLAAITDAQTQGIKLSIDTFSVGDGKNYTPVASMTSLYGKTLYSASVTNVESIRTTSIQFTCEVPDIVPDVGETWSISEIGLYTDTGILFAVGLVEPYHVKYNGVFYRAISSITVATTDVFAVNINTHQSLPYVAHITSLESPIKVVENAVIVGDGRNNNPYRDTEASTTLATKYGGAAEISEWAFSGFTRIFHKVNPIVTDDSTFKISDFEDFWLYDQEVVLVQVVIGASTGQTRKFVYEADAPPSTNGRFVMVGADAFFNFSDIDKINIWRSDAYKLPDPIGVAEGRTLQINKGVPDWGVAGGSYDLGQYRYPFKIVRQLFDGDNYQKVFTLLESDVCYSIIGINGAVQGQSAYGIVGQELVFTSPPCAGRHEILMFVPDTDKSNNGAEAVVHNEMYTVGVEANPYGFNAGNTELQLETGPADGRNLLVFHAHSFMTSEEYTYNPDTNVITFTESLIDGITEVRWFEFNETSTGSVVSLQKRGFIGDGQQLFTVDTSVTQENSFVFTQGGYHETGIYTIAGDTIDIGTTIVGRRIEIISFVNQIPDISAMLVRGDPYVPALNASLCPLKDGDLRTTASVPQMFIGGTWRTLVESQGAHVVTFEGDGSRITFDLDVAPRAKEHVRVNLEGQILMLSQFSINETILTLALDTPPPNGRIIEIVVFSYWAFNS